MFERVSNFMRRGTLRDDAVAGVVLGGQSVPDGLAGGLLAGVNPVYGLYGYLFGMLGAAFVTGSQFMTVQATGAMAAVVSDVDAVQQGADDAERALFTLALLTGAVMIVAGVLKLGSILRFVSNAVMVGFISGVGINIVLGQLGDFTGYDAAGTNRIVRALDTVLHPGRLDGHTIVVGAVTIVLILVLERTRLGALSLVVAVIVGSAIVPLLDWEVAILSDIVSIPGGLPLPEVPLFSKVPSLLLPAFSLAFVGLVQGAGITANFPNPDGTYPNASRDFIGQGVGNLVSGTFQGMPVGGSMSATSIVTAAGSRSRAAQIIAAAVMAVTIVVFGSLVEEIAMPALAGLLMVVGFRTVKPGDIVAVWKTGSVRAATMFVTLVLTVLIPLQFAVLVGVGMSTLLYVIRQSNDLVVKRWIPEDGGFREVEPPPRVPPNEVVLIQPYGSLFFASAAVFEERIPVVTAETENSVVIVRLRGRTDLGSTLAETISRYAESLRGANSKLVLISDSDRVLAQIDAAGAIEILGEHNLYRSDEWLGRTMRTAHGDAMDWIAARQ